MTQPSAYERLMTVLLEFESLLKSHDLNDLGDLS